MLQWTTQIAEIMLLMNSSPVIFLSWSYDNFLFASVFFLLCRRGKRLVLQMTVSLGFLFFRFSFTSPLFQKIMIDLWIAFSILYEDALWSTNLSNLMVWNSGTRHCYIMNRKYMQKFNLSYLLCLSKKKVSVLLAIFWWPLGKFVVTDAIEFIMLFSFKEQGKPGVCGEAIYGSFICFNCRTNQIVYVNWCFEL